MARISIRAIKWCAVCSVERVETFSPRPSSTGHRTETAAKARSYGQGYAALPPSNVKLRLKHPKGMTHAATAQTLRVTKA